MDFIKATQFSLIHPFRKLTHTELVYRLGIYRLYLNISKSEIVAELPFYLSKDGKSRPLYLAKNILGKITLKHGEFCIENLLINAHDWDYAILNIDKNKNKINLIKLVDDQNLFLIIGAIRNNGYFMLTHFETQIVQGNELKSLLGRGDVLSKDSCPGSSVLPSEAL